MRIGTIIVFLSFVASTAVLAQPSGPHREAGHSNGGTAQTHSALPENLNHGGLMTPHATNDRGVIPANPSTDRDMRNPGSSQNLITHAEPKS